MNLNFFITRPAFNKDIKGWMLKVEKAENHEFLGKFSLNLANFDIPLLYTSLRYKQSCQKSLRISFDFQGLVERCGQEIQLIY